MLKQKRGSLGSSGQNATSCTDRRTLPPATLSLRATAASAIAVTAKLQKRLKIEQSSTFGSSVRAVSAGSCGPNAAATAGSNKVGSRGLLQTSYSRNAAPRTGSRTLQHCSHYCILPHASHTSSSCPGPPQAQRGSIVCKLPTSPQISQQLSLASSPTRPNGSKQVASSAQHWSVFSCSKPRPVVVTSSAAVHPTLSHSRSPHARPAAALVTDRPKGVLQTARGTSKSGRVCPGIHSRTGGHGPHITIRGR